MDKKNNERSAVNLDALNFQIRESYKTARTNIAYSIIKKGCKKIVLTSSDKSEGKTITSVNIAIALSQQVGTKVLIIDCDLRRPTVHSAMKITPTPGLTNYLNDECTAEDIIKTTRFPTLNVVCYGAIPPNPSELLASEAMEAFIAMVEKEYDYIIFDTPPIGVVIDAMSVIKMADGVVVVVKDDYTTYPELNRTLETITRSGGKTLGVIFNRVKDLESKKYKKKYKKGYGYYGYYGY